MIDFSVGIAGSLEMANEQLDSGSTLQGHTAGKSEGSSRDFSASLRNTRLVRAPPLWEHSLPMELEQTKGSRLSPLIISEFARIQPALADSDGDHRFRIHAPPFGRPHDGADAPGPVARNLRHPGQIGVIRVDLELVFSPWARGRGAADFSSSRTHRLALHRQTNARNDLRDG